jgi:toxin ParE1/3/4
LKFPVVQSARAGRDLVEHFAFIAHDDPDAALRLLSAYEQATRLISDFPELGGIRTLRHSKLKRIRVWTLKGFDKYIVVYQIRARSILVLRVLHSAQDYTSFFPS